jgi:hypothetical protein
MVIVVMTSNATTAIVVVCPMVWHVRLPCIASIHAKMVTVHNKRIHQKVMVPEVTHQKVMDPAVTHQKVMDPVMEEATAKMMIIQLKIQKEMNHM